MARIDLANDWQRKEAALLLRIIRRDYRDLWSDPRLPKDFSRRAFCLGAAADRAEREATSVPVNEPYMTARAYRFIATVLREAV